MQLPAAAAAAAGTDGALVTPSHRVETVAIIVDVYARRFEGNAAVRAAGEHQALRPAVRALDKGAAAAGGDRVRAPQDAAGKRMRAVIDRDVGVLIASEHLVGPALVRHCGMSRQHQDRRRGH